MERPGDIGEIASASLLARVLACVAHLAPVLVTLGAALMSVIAERAAPLALFGWIVPLGCWLALRRAEPFAAMHALASLELRLTLLLFFVGPAVFVGREGADAGGPQADDFLFLDPRTFLPVMVLLALTAGEGLCSLFGAVAAARGRPFRYPLALPLFGLFPFGRRTGFERASPGG